MNKVMKTAIRYSVLFYSGNKGKLKVNYTCPDFTDKEIEPLIINGKQLSDGHTHTIEMQIDEWVGEFDKKQWMEQNEVMMIFNWEVISAKSKLSANLLTKQKTLTQPEMVGLFVQMSNMSEELKTEFIAVYSEIKPAVKDLKFDKQIDITFKTLSVGFKAATNVYKYLNEFTKTINSMRTDDYSQISYGERKIDKELMLNEAKKITVSKIINNGRLQ